jgi:hypothetical protein
LERAKNQLAVHHPIEPRPPESHRLVNGRCHVAHDGYQVLLALNERRYLTYQQLVLFFFHGANLHNNSEIQHGKPEKVVIRREKNTAKAGRSQNRAAGLKKKFAFSF